MNAVSILKKPLLAISPLIDAILYPFSMIAALCLYVVRRYGISRLPMVRAGLEKIGIYPLRHHYYESLFYKKDLKHPLTQPRDIVGLELNIPEQLATLKLFQFQDELRAIPFLPQPGAKFYFHNHFFQTGDAEMLYNFIRYYKPSRLIEIGSGWSTHLARMAIEQNQQLDPNYRCHHVCIEPFEHPELESLGIDIIRKKVEDCDLSLFETLAENDILFIDSSHVIRPQGDVLVEIQQILGRLNKGVFVHVHDIYTPRDYLEGSLIHSQIFWNEQYLLESFLSFNDRFKIIASVNHLWHSHKETISHACPMLAQDPSAEPCSFWFQRV